MSSTALALQEPRLPLHRFADVLRRRSDVRHQSLHPAFGAGSPRQDRYRLRHLAHPASLSHDGRRGPQRADHRPAKERQALYPFRHYRNGLRRLPAYNLDTGSTQVTVAMFLTVTGLGLGLIMPTATLAVQNTVEKEILVVATSAARFIRSLGSTVGTAVIGSIVTKGYAEDLAAGAPTRAPESLVSTLQSPQALVSDEARDALAGIAFPGSEQVVDQVIGTTRQALSASILRGLRLRALLRARCGRHRPPDEGRLPQRESRGHRGRRGDDRGAFPGRVSGTATGTAGR